MNIRLQQLITAEGLNNRRFAEKMGIQSSNVSHIINGRNKPGYDFIARLFEVFPNINPYWLILGQGNMYNDLQDSSAVADGDYEANYTVKPEPKGEMHSLGRNDIVNKSFDDKVDDIATSQTQIDFGAPKDDSTHSTQVEGLASQPTQKNINNSSVVSYADSDSIDQVVVFYCDGTFKTYSKR